MRASRPQIEQSDAGRLRRAAGGNEAPGASRARQFRTIHRTGLPPDERPRRGRGIPIKPRTRGRSPPLAPRNADKHEVMLRARAERAPGRAPASAPARLRARSGHAPRPARPEPEACDHAPPGDLERRDVCRDVNQKCTTLPERWRVAASGRHTFTRPDATSPRIADHATRREGSAPRRARRPRRRPREPSRLPGTRRRCVAGSGGEGRRSAGRRARLARAGSRAAERNGTTPRS